MRGWVVDVVGEAAALGTVVVVVDVVGAVAGGVVVVVVVVGAGVVVVVVGGVVVVVVGGLTNPAAVELSRILVEITPEPLQQVFLCDSGSVSIETANSRLPLR